MLIDRSVLYLVHLVKLSLEEDKFLSRIRHRVDASSLVLLEGIDNLEEVLLLHEELVVLGFRFLYSRQWIRVGKVCTYQRWSQLGSKVRPGQSTLSKLMIGILAA